MIEIGVHQCVGSWVFHYFATFCTATARMRLLA